MFSSIIDHKSTCKGYNTCIVCGRKGCNGCICQPKFDPLNTVGKCVICAGMYTKDEIILFPPPDRDWDK